MRHGIVWNERGWQPPPPPPRTLSPRGIYCPLPGRADTARGSLFRVTKWVCETIKSPNASAVSSKLSVSLDPGHSRTTRETSANWTAKRWCQGRQRGISTVEGDGEGIVVHGAVPQGSEHAI